MDQFLGTLGIYIATIEIAIFLVLYGVFSSWRKTEYGRYIFFSNSVLGLILGFIAVRNLFGDYAPFAYLRLFVFLLVPVYLGWQLWLFYKIQRKSKPEVPNDRRANSS